MSILECYRYCRDANRFGTKIQRTLRVSLLVDSLSRYYWEFPSDNHLTVRHFNDLTTCNRLSTPPGCVHMVSVCFAQPFVQQSSRITEPPRTSYYYPLSAAAPVTQRYSHYYPSSTLTRHTYGSPIGRSYSYSSLSPDVQAERRRIDVSSVHLCVSGHGVTMFMGLMTIEESSF